MAARVQGVLRELRGYPRQFWILVGGTFIYVGAAALGFPYEGIYLRRQLHVSMSWIGVVYGAVPIAMTPLQVWGGALTDRFGRRTMLILSASVSVAWFVGFAFARSLWQVAVLVAIETAFGWPLFQTASGAMIADLLPRELRAEAFSISRVAMNAGVVVGPAVGALVLGLGVSFRDLFLLAALGCLLFMLITIWGVRETIPQTALSDDVPERRRSDGAAVTAAPAAHVPSPIAGTEAVATRPRRGYGMVLADRRFLVFCIVALLPVFCFGTFTVTFSVFITTDLGVPYSTWGLLLALNAFIVAGVQYPLVRALRTADHLVLLAAASALIGLGLGLSAFVGPRWLLVILVVVLSFGEMLLSPIAASVVSDMAPEAVRGRYMGVWTVIWSGGQSLGLLVTGLAVDAVGGRGTFGMVLVAGLAGAALFLVVRGAERRAGRRGWPGAGRPAH